MNIAILGGSGKLGRGLAARIAGAGHRLVIGSRDPLKGKSYEEAAAWCDAAIVTVPYAAHYSLLQPLRESLRGKIVIDATAPLDPSDPLRLRTTSGASAAEEAAALLEGAHVYAAFQTVSHRVLEQLDLSHDVLVAGAADRKPQVLEFIRSLNLRPIDAGPLRIAHALETLTTLLISINRQNKLKESGIHITGIPGQST